MKDTIKIPLSVLESLCDDVEIDFNNTQDDLAMKAINSLKSERDELKRQLENFNVSSIHSCHAQCKRPMCVLRRERDEAREKNKKLREALLRVRTWGIESKNFSSNDNGKMAHWIDEGCTGELPEPDGPWIYERMEETK